MSLHYMPQFYLKVKNLVATCLGLAFLYARTCNDHTMRMQAVRKYKIAAQKKEELRTENTLS